MDAAHKTLEIGGETQRSSHIKGSDKGVASDKRCNIYSPALDPRGVTLIFSHIRRVGPFFWVQNSEFQYFLGFSEK